MYSQIEIPISLIKIGKKLYNTADAAIAELAVLIWLQISAVPGLSLVTLKVGLFLFFNSQLHQWDPVPGNICEVCTALVEETLQKLQ